MWSYLQWSLDRERFVLQETMKLRDKIQERLIAYINLQNKFAEEVKKADPEHGLSIIRAQLLVAMEDLESFETNLAKLENRAPRDFFTLRIPPTTPYGLAVEVEKKKGP